MRGRALVLVALANGLWVNGLWGPAAAQVDPGAPEGAVRTVESLRALDSYALPVGTFRLDAPAVRDLEGAVAWSAWRLDAPEATVAGVMQGYRERLRAQGFEALWECAGDACGGFDFRFGAEILPPPGMLLDVRDFAQLSAARAEPEGFVSVLVSRVLESIYVQTVSVAPAPPPAGEAVPTEAAAAGAATREAAADGTEGQPAPASEAATPEAASSASGMGPDTAPGSGAPPEPARPAGTAAAQDGDALRARLTSEGHVPVQGLDFETGGAALSPGSAAAIDRLAAMLSEPGAPAVIVVGHSDNRGGLEMNVELSRRRAEALRQALIERGVPAERLEARGVGFLAPVASNATEAGRAMNRRVELVPR